MAELNCDGKTLELNEDGFLVRPEEWNDRVAQALARDQEGLEALTDEHWTVVRFIRDYYIEKQLAPMVRAVCKSTGLPLRRIYELFPSGPAKGACKVAGLPKPDGCV